MVEERRFEQLAYSKRPGDGHDRDVGVDNATLCNRPDLNVIEAAGCGQPVEKLGAEDRRAGRRGHCGKCVDVGAGDLEVTDPGEERVEAGKDAEAGLVGAVVRR